MALPPQAIEKLIREPSRSQGAYRELLLISGAMLGLAVIIYAGLAFGYRAYLDSSLQKTEAEIAKFSASIKENDRAQIQEFYSQFVNLRTLLAGHTAASPVMTLLERTIQPDVYYTKLTINVGTNQVALAGAAKSLEAIAGQAASFQGQPEVDRVDFNNAGAQATGPWQFTMTVYLKPNVFHGVIIKTPEPPAAPVPTSTAPVASTTPAVSTSTPR